MRSAIDRDNTAWVALARRSKVRGARCALGDASEQQAAFWGVSATTWRGQLLKGMLETDLAQVARDGRRAREMLKRGKTLRVTAANGSDVTMKLRGRTPVIDDGVVGPATTSRAGNSSPSPRRAAPSSPWTNPARRGSSSATGSSYLPSGLGSEGGQWELHGGRLTNAWFTEGHPTFETALNAAPRGRDVVGLIAIGLNPALAPGTPQVEEQAGAVTIAVGGNRDYGGTNRGPFLAWIVVGEATVAIEAARCSTGKLL